MNELIKLNRALLIKAYLWISGITTFFFIVYLCFFYSEISPEWIVTIFLFTLLICPGIVLGTWISDWYRRRRYLKRIMSFRPYSQLEKIGFSRTTVMEGNALKDYACFAVIQDVPVIFNTDLTKQHVARFTVYCNTFNLSQRQFSDKFHECRHKGIDLGFSSVARSIDTRKEPMSVQNIEMLLSDLVSIVKINKFELIPITEWEL